MELGSKPDLFSSQHLATSGEGGEFRINGLHDVDTLLGKNSQLGDSGPFSILANGIPDFAGESQCFDVVVDDVVVRFIVVWGHRSALSHLVRDGNRRVLD